MPALPQELEPPLDDPDLPRLRQRREIEHDAGLGVVVEWCERRVQVLVVDDVGPGHPWQRREHLVVTFGIDDADGITAPEQALDQDPREP